MGDRADSRWLMAGVAAMIAVLLAGELYHHMIIKPVPLPTLLFELVEVVLLLGCAVACTLMIRRVRVREMAAATGAMISLLLVGELYLGDKLATPWTLLLEVLEIGLLVGCAAAWALLVRRVGAQREGRPR